MDELDLAIATADHAKGVKITPQGRFLVNCQCGWHSPNVLLIESRIRADAIWHEHVEDIALAEQYSRNTAPDDYHH